MEGEQEGVEHRGIGPSYEHGRARTVGFVAARSAVSCASVRSRGRCSRERPLVMKSRRTREWVVEGVCSRARRFLISPESKRAALWLS